MALFRQGLNPVLREHPTLFRGCTLNELVSASIEQEDACRAHVEEERKMRHTAQVPLGLHHSFRPATWSPFVSTMESPSTSVGGPTPSSLPIASCSTSSSAANWGGLPVFQLQAD
jgi:hypothetical protein